MKQKKNIFLFFFNMTFNIARSALVTAFTRVQFAVVDKVTKQDNGFFAFARVKSLENGSLGAKVYFNQRAGSNTDFHLGPVTIAAHCGVPCSGDIIMGVIVDEKTKPRFAKWWGGCNALYHLASIARYGTCDSEQQVLMNMHDHNVWALCRLVLFENVAVFSKMHTNTLAPNSFIMQLCKPPLEFVHMVSTEFKDASIWDKFKVLTPDANPPFTVQPWVPYNPEQPGYDEEMLTSSPPYRPMSPAYTPTSPPMSPRPIPRVTTQETDELLNLLQNIQ